MGVQAVLAVVLLFIATVKAGPSEGEIAIWRSEVTLICPQGGEWHNTDEKIAGYENNKTYTFTYTRKARFACVYEGKKYGFYVEGRVCENCFELDAKLFLMILLVDILGTIVVMIIIYSCTKNKSPAGPPQPSKAPPRSGGRAPPVPSPDYEPLNHQTRSQDTYSTVVNRMG